MSKVLVTGANGFIGSHLVEALVRRGDSVRALVEYNSQNSWGWLDSFDQEVIDALEIVTGDIRDSHCVREIVAGQDVVYHLAALIAIPYSYRAPESYVETNIRGTLNVVQAARDLDVSKVVHTSTSEVYGSAQFVPITEQHPLVGQSPYSATKIAADQIALSFHHSFATPVAVIRPFNTYGPRQSARAVIPTIITQVLAGNREIELGDLSPTRDFSFVRDTVSAFLSIADSPRAIGEVINIGSGHEISIGDLAALIGDTTGVDVNIVSQQDRVRPAGSEVQRLCADTAKAQDLLSWQPEYAGQDGLARGLLETIEWFREPGNMKFFKPSLYNI